MQYLTSSQKIDGSWGDPYGTALRETTAAAGALQLLDPARPNYSTALQWLQSQGSLGYDYVSRKLYVLSQTTSDVSSDLAYLKSGQKPDGGFGLDPDHESDVADTALALQALVATGQASTDTAARGVGYLLNQQQPNGGFADGANDPSVYLTALSFRALWFYRNTNTNVPAALARARDFLLSQRDAAGSWGEPFNTALALTALIPYLPDTSLVAGSIAALQSAQLANGSWGNDPYTTALALQALYLAGLPQPNPDYATIQGRVVDAQTGLPLSGVAVALAGAASAAFTTRSDGAFVFRNLGPGSYSLQLALINYATLSVSTVAGVGQSVDLGAFALAKSQGAATGTLRGTVTDATTGAPLGEVIITVSGLSSPVLTDAAGNYQVANVTPGAITVSASKAGYATATGAATLAPGGIMVFSPRLATSTNPQGAALEGVVTDGASNVPLPGVTVSVTGSAIASAATDAQGRYRIEGLAAGTISITVSLAGYDAVTAGAVVSLNSTVRFSPRLYASGTTPPNANTAGVTGVVLDAGTSQPLSGVTTTASFAGITQTLTTDGAGRFTLNGITSPQGNLRFTRAGYVGSDVFVALEPLTTLDLGQVRLRREQASILLPDLTVTTVSRRAAVTDPNTLQLAGTLSADVTNAGNANAPANIRLLAFYDVNRNGAYDTGDVALGQATTTAAITVGAMVSVLIPVQGELPFRDAPVSVWVDSGQSVAELREDNNTGSTASVCGTRPAVGSFQPTLKWAWRGSNVIPSHDQVMSIPIVAPIEDTNGDGRIDQRDIPGVIFHTFQTYIYSADGVLRAVSGKDGRELWTVTDPAYRTNPVGSIAVADLDGDGMVEIVVPKQGGGLIAFRHDGTFLWKTAPTLDPTVTIGWGGPAIADLDGDGRPEIVISNVVLNADGTLRWRGIGFAGVNFTGTLPVVADTNLDGKPEVIAGASAYSSAGQLLWANYAVGEGLVAVGNFNTDPYPEIVVVGAGRVFLLDHIGNLIWGPVTLPGGGYGSGYGGAPTVADMDGDGIPEIGVAGASRYTVFKADGSVLWSVPTVDPSGVTGSSVFDFDGDGQAEVVYADEQFLRIYRGRDGTLLFETPNTSGTAFEIPVIVDVDNDGHADIIVAINDYYRRGYGTGVRVYTDANNSWVDTRKIWNQHSYHITNINDDGTVPRAERNSWQVNNTYRLNAFADRGPIGAPDLTASLLRLVDNGAGQSLSITLRVGNAGGSASPDQVPVSFYQGDPVAGGMSLGTLNLAPVAVGDYRDVRLDNISLTGTADLYVVVDSTSRVAECDETNNTARIPAAAVAILGRIVVASDAASYGANAPVLLTANVSNIGALPATFTVELKIEDRNGAPVTGFPARGTGVVGSGAVSAISENWNTALTLAGSYRLRGILRDVAGARVHESVAAFDIRQPGSAGPVVSLRLFTDRPVYYTTDRVNIQSLVGNATLNTIVESTQLRLSVINPAGQTVFSQNGNLSQLPPGAIMDLLLPYSFQGALVAVYRVQGQVVDLFTQAVLAQAATQYEVRFDLNKSLVGKVQVAATKLEIGATQTCTDQLTNTGTITAAGLEVRYAVVNLDSQQLMTEQIKTVDLPAGGQSTFVQGFTTAGMPAGNYACTLRAKIDNTLKTLAFAPFTLVPPPVRINAELRPGGKGRFLILLDSGRGEEHRPASEADPYGPPGAPGLTAQRSFLESLLKQAGWSYTITDAPESFTREIYSGGYSVYALFAEKEKLSEEAQKVLREAVFRGEGLFVAGPHDARHYELHAALGLKLIGRVATAIGVDLPPGTLGVSGSMTLIPGDKALRIKRLTAQSAGVYRLGAATSSGSDEDNDGPDCRDDSESYRRSATDKSSQSDGETGRDECEGGPQNYLDAVTLNSYGLGRSVFSGFDLLALATRDGVVSLAAQTLLKALDYVQPNPMRLYPGTVVAVDLNLENRGSAVTVQASVTLPAGVRVIDAGGAQVLGSNLRWALPLAIGETRSLTFWIRLPDTPGAVSLQGRVEGTVAGGAPVLAAEPVVLLTVEPAVTPAELVARIDNLLTRLSGQGPALRQAREALTKAENYWPGRPEKALIEALRAAEALQGSIDPEIVALHADIAVWIRLVAQALRQG